MRWRMDEKETNKVERKSWNSYEKVKRKGKGGWKENKEKCSEKEEDEGETE